MPDAPVSSVESAPSGELSKSQRKSAGSAGYLVERFAAACDALRKRVQDGRVPLPSPWREALGGAPSTTIQGDGWFVMELLLPEDGKLRLLPRLLSQDDSARIVAAWLAKNPGASAETLLANPVGFHIPWWTAFLRLRSLRDFWEAELRRSAWEQLVALLPDAWLLDRAPLPPGAVIPRLEITDWNEPPSTMGDEQNFGVQRADGEWITADDAATAAARDSSSVLVELFLETAGRKFGAIYVKQGARVDLVGVVSER